MRTSQHSATQHHCAVCPKPIGYRYLMCFEHWALVPADQQHAVNQSWGRYMGCQQPRLASGMRLLDAYKAARDQAIAAATAAMQPACTMTSTTTTQGENQLCQP